MSGSLSVDARSLPLVTPSSFLPLLFRAISRHIHSQYSPIRVDLQDELPASDRTASRFLVASRGQPSHLLIILGIAFKTVTAGPFTITRPSHRLPKSLGAHLCRESRMDVGGAIQSGHRAHHEHIRPGAV